MAKNMMGKLYTKNEMAYEWLREKIVNGDLGQGEKIIIREISKQFGISDIPVREALKKLESEGLVKNVPHVGARVCNFKLKELAEMMVIRVELETLAIRLASNNMSQKTIRQLEDSINNMENAQKNDDYKAYYSFVREFCFTVYKNSLNETLYNLIDSLWERSEIGSSIYVYIPEWGERSLGVHRKILEALRTGDGHKAEKLFKDYKTEALRTFIKKLEEEKL